MCLIVDVNRSDHLLQTGDKTLGEVLLAMLKKGEVKIATGGKNLDELVAYKRQFTTILQEYSRSGWLMIYNRKKLEAISVQLDASGSLRSNDSHNLALAILSGAHVILSNDNALIDDFKDSKIVPIRRNCNKGVLRGDACAPRARHLACCACHPPN